MQNKGAGGRAGSEGLGLELGLDRELAEESWDLGQSWGRSRGVGEEPGGTSGCTSPMPHSVKGALSVGVVSKDSHMGTWHRRAVQGGKGLWVTGGAQGLGQALLNRSPHQGWK